MKFIANNDGAVVVRIASLSLSIYKRVLYNNTGSRAHSLNGMWSRIMCAESDA
jgi:hypothetical protein